MKKLLFLALSVVAAASALPITCVSAALSTYDVSGFSCTEGGITFSNFTFSVTGNESPVLKDSDVSLSPFGGDGFQIQAAFSAPSGVNLDALIGYTATVSLGSFTGDQLSMLGFAVSGTGAINIAESVCVGAALSGGVCQSPGVLKTLDVFDNSGGISASQSVTFAGSPTTLGILKDLSVTGGTGLSAAQVSVVDNLTPFASAIPEPFSMSLTGLGLCLLVAGALRRK